MCKPNWTGSKDREISHLGASSNPSVFCNHQNKHSRCNDLICNSSEVNLEQLAKAKKLGILKLSPVDEVEGEIIYFQKRLLGNAVARKHFTGPFLFRLYLSSFFFDMLALFFIFPFLHYSHIPFQII
jgi:hypothetical protein